MYRDRMQVSCTLHFKGSKRYRLIYWKGIKQQSLINVQGWTLRHCPHVSIFIWKLNFFFTDTASVHTYPMKTINEDGTFRKRSQSGTFWKRCFTWTCEQTKRDWLFDNAEDILSVPIHSAQSLETHSRWRIGASLSCLLYLAGLISNLTACFQAN